MPGEPVLEMEALDITGSPWEDLKREVLADDPDGVAPLFIGDSERSGVFLCCGTGGCSACGDCVFDCACCSCDCSQCNGACASNEAAMGMETNR